MTKTIAQLIDDYSQGITTRQNEKQARRDKFANQVTTILSDAIGRTLQRGDDQLVLSKDVVRNKAHNQNDHDIEELYNEVYNNGRGILVVWSKKETTIDLVDLFVSLGYIYVRKAYLSKTQVNRKTIRYELEMTFTYQD